MKGSISAGLLGNSRGSVLVFALLTLGLCVCPALAQIGQGIDPATQLELDYARILNENGFPDIAEAVVKRIKHPDAAMLSEVIKVQALIARGEFDKVIKLIGSKPDQKGQKVWALKLSLADGYYAWGRYAEAQTVYDSFFKAYPTPPAALKRFFMESAYKYAQMLILMGKENESIKAYDLALVVLPKTETKQRHIRRQLLGEKAELLMKMADAAKGDKRNIHIEAIEKIMDELMWLQDIWFGKSIVMQAHIKMMKDDIKGAEKLLEDYKLQLQGIDTALKEEAIKRGEDLTKLSPMAECRYLLGKMMQDKAMKLHESGGADKEIEELLVGRKYQMKIGRKVVEKRTKGAFQHLINVFVKYPSTNWAPDAGKRAKAIQEVLEEMGVEISYEIKDEDLEKVMSAQFLAARSLYNQKQYRKAIKSYIDVLNLFPEGETSVSALGELAASYLEIQTEPNEMAEFHVDMVLHYIAERFVMKDELMMNAGDQLLKLAAMYEEREILNRRDEIYDLFFAKFTKHPRSAAMLFMFGDKYLSENDIETAKSYFERIGKDYSHVPLYTDAMAKLATCYEQADDYVSQIKTLTSLIKALEKKPKPGYPLISAKFRLATALKKLSSEYLKTGRAGGESSTKYLKLGNKYLVASLKRFNDIASTLKDKEKKKDFYKTKEQEEALETFLQGAMFYQAACYASIATGKEATDIKYKKQAIKISDELVKMFPESQFAPPALSQILTLYTILGGNDKEITKTAQFLQKNYPKSREAEDADYLLARSLLEMGRRRAAIKAFKRMFDGSGAKGFSVSKILTAGTELLNAGEYEISAQAFDQVLKKAKKPVQLQPAMVGSGKANMGLKNYKEAAKILTEMLEKYPRSGYTVEAALALSAANSTLASKEPDKLKRRELFDEAVRAMKEVRKYALKDAALKTKSDVGVARILELKSQAEKEFGDEAAAFAYRKNAVAAYQTVIMFANASAPGIKPHLEDAYAEGGPLLLDILEEEKDLKMRIEEYENIIIDCGKYNKLFPAGKRASEVRRVRTKANAQLTMAKQRLEMSGGAESDEEKDDGAKTPE